MEVRLYLREISAIKSAVLNHSSQYKMVLFGFVGWQKKNNKSVGLQQENKKSVISFREEKNSQNTSCRIGLG